MKKIILLVSVILIFTACGEKKEPIDIKVMVPYGTPALTMAKMIEEKPQIMKGLTVDYETIQATDVLAASIINNEVDIAVIPTNLAATLFGKGVDYKLAGPSIWGVLYLVSSEDINSISDLKGKTISLMGRGLSPDGLMQYMLTENGLNPEIDVTLEYFSGSTELATSFITGESDIAMIPEPLLTNVLMKREDASVVLDLQEEWTKITGFEKYPQASLVISNRLIEERPDVVDSFIQEYSKSVEWLNDNPAKAGVYYESLEIGLSATIVEQAIPNCNLEYMSAKEAKEALNAYLNVLYEFNPKLLGNKEVDEAMYFEK